MTVTTAGWTLFTSRGRSSRSLRPPRSSPVSTRPAEITRNRPATSSRTACPILCFLGFLGSLSLNSPVLGFQLFIGNPPPYGRMPQDFSGTPERQVGDPPPVPIDLFLVVLVFYPHHEIKHW